MKIVATDIEDALAAHHSPELLDELHALGTMMVTEVTGRVTLLDTKALSVLGYTAAILAFLFFGRPAWISSSAPVEVALITVAVVLALGSLAVTFLALRIRTWEWPSEHDWFREDLFANPDALRRYHVLSLLETHKTHAEAANQKATRVRRAQWLLVLSAATVGVALLLSLLGGAFAPLLDVVGVTSG